MIHVYKTKWICRAMRIWLCESLKDQSHFFGKYIQNSKTIWQLLEVNSSSFWTSCVVSSAAICTLKSHGFFPASQLNNWNGFANTWQMASGKCRTYTANMDLQTLPDTQIFWLIEVIQILAKKGIIWQSHPNFEVVNSAHSREEYLINGQTEIHWTSFPSLRGAELT